MLRLEVAPVICLMEASLAERAEKGPDLGRKLAKALLASSFQRGQVVGNDPRDRFSRAASLRLRAADKVMVQTQGQFGLHVLPPDV